MSPDSRLSVNGFSPRATLAALAALASSRFISIARSPSLKPFLMISLPPGIPA